MSTRKRVYEFLMLPHITQIERAQAAGVYDRDELESAKSTIEVFTYWAEKARAKGTIDILFPPVAERSEVVSCYCSAGGQKGHPLHTVVDGGARPDLKRELEICVSSLSTPYNYFASRHDAQSEQCATAVGETIEALEKLAEGGARELEQAAQRVVTLYDSDAEDVEIDAAMDELRLAVDRRKR